MPPALIHKDMSLILSLQGCMAAGKTTAARYIASHAPDIHAMPEDNLGVIDEVRRRGLKKDVYEDYLAIQRLFLRNEVRRWREAQPFSCAVMDFGAEEIEFYTLRYPLSIGRSWDVTQALAEDLSAARACMPQRILFLDAQESTLRKRKEADSSRSRAFFDHYLTHLLPLKRAWFLTRPDVDVLHVDDMRPEEVGRAAIAWARVCMARHYSE